MKEFKDLKDYQKKAVSILIGGMAESIDSLESEVIPYGERARIASAISSSALDAINKLGFVSFNSYSHRAGFLSDALAYSKTVDSVE